MKISMQAMTGEVFVPMLHSLSKMLDKGAQYAAEKKFDVAVLANARLAPDMFSLVQQVQLACDFAKFAMARLGGQDPPRDEDQEKTLDELKVRIRRTVDYIESLNTSALEGSEDRDIKIPLRETTLDMKGLTYLKSWALPNFYFHVVTAYAILRHNNVDVGKRAFLDIF
jgi:uncharacterized protein